FEKEARFVQREPVRERDKQVLGLLAGIEKGKPFAPDARMRGLLSEAARVGHAMTAALAYEARYPDSCVGPTATGRKSCSPSSPTS
ncbi:MAG: hypothetical protein ACRDOP_01495, partial [Gaiellaceae bacterium]